MNYIYIIIYLNFCFSCKFKYINSLVFSHNTETFEVKRKYSFHTKKISIISLETLKIFMKMVTFLEGITKKK